MTTMQPAAGGGRDYRKWALFAVMGVLAVLAISADEKFLIDPTQGEWTHIAPFKWWLLPHGLAGATALALGPAQFSTRIRRANPALHRLLGKIYIAAVCISAPLSIVIANSWNSPVLALQETVQAGAWLLCALLAYGFAVKRNLVTHKQWVARSYGFTFIFVTARVPDFFGWHWPDDGALAAYQWCLVVVALIIPDLIVQWDQLFSRRLRA